MIKNILISPAQKQDMQKIYQLYKKFAAYEKLEKYFTASFEEWKCLVEDEKLLHILKAVDNGKIIGFAAYYYQLVTFPAKKVLFLEDIFVIEEARGKGIGHRFFDELQKTAQLNNCIKMEWKCLKWNKASQAFYEGIGAKEDREWMIYDLNL